MWRSVCTSYIVCYHWLLRIIFRSCLGIRIRLCSRSLLHHFDYALAFLGHKDVHETDFFSHEGRETEWLESASPTTEHLRLLYVNKSLTFHTDFVNCHCVMNTDWFTLSSPLVLTCVYICHCITCRLATFHAHTSENSPAEQLRRLCCCFVMLCDSDTIDYCHVPWDHPPCPKTAHRICLLKLFVSVMHTFMLLCAVCVPLCWLRLSDCAKLKY